MQEGPRHPIARSRVVAHVRSHARWPCTLAVGRQVEEGFCQSRGPGTWERCMPINESNARQARPSGAGAVWAREGRGWLRGGGDAEHPACSCTVSPSAPARAMCQGGARWLGGWGATRMSLHGQPVRACMMMSMHACASCARAQGDGHGRAVRAAVPLQRPGHARLRGAGRRVCRLLPHAPGLAGPLCHTLPQQRPPSQHQQNPTHPSTPRTCVRPFTDPLAVHSPAHQRPTRVPSHRPLTCPTPAHLQRNLYTCLTITQRINSHSSPHVRRSRLPAVHAAQGSLAACAPDARVAENGAQCFFPADFNGRCGLDPVLLSSPSHSHATPSPTTTTLTHTPSSLPSCLSLSHPHAPPPHPPPLFSPPKTHTLARTRPPGGPAAT